MLHLEEESAIKLANMLFLLQKRGIKEDVFQMKEAEYIKYTLELAEFNYEDEIEVYHQITSHTYLTKEAQA
ncbi:hypothetical protein G9A89_017887 [Geosiphon pyriformis]|nr:hypothetical protein G9A89_017887 [Geosiphon pyriformis]